MTFAELSKKIATCYNSLPALVDALRDGFASLEGGGGSSEFEYSTEEKKIGKWIDGKPLYQKTVIIPNTSIIDKDFTFHHEISSIDKIISANGMIWELGADSGRYSYFIPLSDNSNSTLSLRASKTDIYFRGSNSFSVDANRNMYVTLQYTKITD